MRTLVNHLIRTNWDEIKEKSLLHCHARNVHSIMLLCSPGKTIRLFFAESNHDLRKNTPLYFSSGLSVGFHAHHCELTICPVLGWVYNWIIKRERRSRASMFLDGYDYRSAIGGKSPSFKHIANYGFKMKIGTWISIPQYMAANEIHTIGAAAGRETAWLVFEGREDSTYHPITFANTNLEKFDWRGMYKKPSEKKILSSLERCGYDVMH